MSTLVDLNPITLEVMLKLQAEVSGASYALYWQYNGEAGEVGTKSSYVTDAYRKELAAQGKTVSFAEASQSVAYSLEGNSPIAQVMRERQSIFIPDMTAVPDSSRSEVAKSYLIDGAAFVPVLGGVIEFGQSHGVKQWSGAEDALRQVIPGEEVQKAFCDGGASYGIFWARDVDKKVYIQ